MKSTRELGILAEKIAEQFYLARGYQLITKNFRLRYGEIDLILQREGELLFVEVKGRKEFRVEHAWSPHWQEKKRKIRRVARTFLAMFPYLEEEMAEFRFDIVYVTQGRVSQRFEESLF